MAKRTDAAKVGAFVIGAAAVFVMAIVVLGSSQWFHKRYQFVCFFKGSVNGLKVGAPVKFRGVPIGSVIAIRINLAGVRFPEKINRARARTFHLPVIIELDQNQFISLGGAAKTLTSSRLNSLIGSGLRARLSTESLLTGLLYVDLDFFPDTPAHLVLNPGQTRYLEIPTLPTRFEVLQESVTRVLSRLDEVDFEGLALSLKQAAGAVRDVAQSKQIKASLIALNKTLESLQTTTANLRRNFNSLSTGTRALAASLQKTSEQASRALQQVQSTMRSLQETINPNSPAVYNLSHAAANLAQASRAVRNLAEELQRNPSMLIRGKMQEDRQQF